MYDWKEYVGYQPNTLIVFYLILDSDNGFKIDKACFEPEDFTLNENELVESLKGVLSEFPQVSIKDEFELTKAKTNSVRLSRRAFPNVNYDNVWYYKGSAAFDCAIMVASHEGKYIIFKHPKFEDYGFKMKK